MGKVLKKNFACTMCTRSYTSGNSLCRHMAEHRPNARYVYLDPLENDTTERKKLAQKRWRDKVKHTKGALNRKLFKV